MKIKLNIDQFEFLRKNLPEEMQKLKQFDKNFRSVTMEIDQNIADETRDWAGEELQVRGFDVNYELTSDGKLLEELIDIFYSQLINYSNKQVC